jgi:hypothetical protein
MRRDKGERPTSPEKRGKSSKNSMTRGSSFSQLQRSESLDASTTDLQGASAGVGLIESHPLTSSQAPSESRRFVATANGELANTGTRDILAAPPTNDQSVQVIQTTTRPRPPSAIPEEVYCTCQLCLPAQANTPSRPLMGSVLHEAWWTIFLVCRKKQLR